MNTPVKNHYELMKWEVASELVLSRVKWRAITVETGCVAAETTAVARRYRVGEPR